MKYVSPEYEQRLNDLAEMLMQKRREAAPKVGQLVLFESEMGNTTVVEPAPHELGEN